MTNPANGAITRALISVYDKKGLPELARALADLGVEIVASGGSAKACADAGVKVTAVEDLTGAKEVLNGRVKTLHPKVHAGILADRRNEAHLAELGTEGYEPIDLVVCNLYPFEEALAAGASHDEQVEKIDIGGPTLVRAAAKNADGGVTVVVDPTDYDHVLSALRQDGSVSLPMRRTLSAKAFKRVAEYDLAIAAWTEQNAKEDSPSLPTRIEGFRKHTELRYGENPQQQAALYLDDSGHGVAHGEQLNGKALSYNNYLDLDAAYRAAWTPSEHSTHRCAIVKHTNPCGLADSPTQTEAFTRALEGDPVSAFGSIIGFNHVVEGSTAQAIRDSKLFVECIVAPDFSDDAREQLQKRANLRLVSVPSGDPSPAWHAHRIGGGMLAQNVDDGIGDPSGWEVVTEKQLEEGWKDELAFAMFTVATLKSNAITVTKGQQLLGAGAGQMSRVDALEQAVKKAGDKTQGAFLASDAFFPFDDCVKLAHAAGIVAIVQPGGSKRDEDSIKACNELGLAMIFTGRRHFRH